MLSQSLGLGTSLYDQLYKSGNKELIAQWENGLAPMLQAIMGLAKNTSTTTTTKD